MKSLKFALGLSLLANIVLVLLALGEHNKVQTMVNGVKQASAAFDQLGESLDHIERDIKDEHLRTIASNDQIDSFLEEHRNYAR